MEATPSAASVTARAWSSRPSRGGAVAFVCCCSVGVGMAARGRRPRTGRRAVASGGQDFYELLGVSRVANEREIKAAFRRQARKWHPDINKEEGAEEKFQAIAKAYKVLSDRSKKERYDQFGEAAVRGATAGPDIAEMKLDDILGDVFSSFFSMRGKQAGADGVRTARRVGSKVGSQKGKDLHCKIKFPFETVCFGGSRTIQIKRRERCAKCEGSGLKEMGASGTCKRCHGSGVAMRVMTTPLGVMQAQQACPHCGGGGVDPRHICLHCKGHGTAQQVKEILVNVPAGCEAGDQLRLRSQGDRGARGGPNGDLYITVQQAPSERFHREGFNIYSEVTLSMYDVALGTTAAVATIDGEAEIQIHPGTQPGTQLRLRGQGVPKLNSSLGKRGDHFVTVNVEIPRRLSEAQVDLLEAMRDLADP